MSDSPNAGIPYVPENTLDPAAGLNLAIDVIDAKLQTAVISMSLNAPPVGPADGDLYIVSGLVGGPATGAWAGLEDKLVRYRSEGTLWQSFDATLVINLDDGGLYKFIVGSPGGWTLAAGLSDAPNDGTRYVRESGAWVVGELAIIDGDVSPPASVEQPVDAIIFTGFNLTNPSPGVVEVEAASSVLGARQYLTIVDETADLPNSKRLLVGPGLRIDTSVAARLKLINTGGFNKEWRNVDAAVATPVGATAIVVVGTQTTPAKATGGGVVGYIGKRRSTSTTAANNVGSFRSGNAQDEVYAGSGGSAAAAGFYSRIVFGTPVVVAGERFFAGFALNAAEAGTADPSALLNCFGVAKDGADTNYQIIHNDGAGAATKIDTGLAFAANKYFELELSVPSGGGSWDYVLRDMDTGTLYTGSINTNIPANDVGLYWRVWGSVGTTAGTAIAVDLSHVGIRYPL